MTQFGVSGFDAHAMAASKVGALHSANRSVPRDIFDLSDLIAQGAKPAPLLGLADRQWLKAISGTTIEKAGAIGWDRAREEVIPYLPQSVRSAFDAAVWEDMCLHVARTVDAWLKDAQ